MSTVQEHTPSLLSLASARPLLALLLGAAVLAVLGQRQGDRPAPHADVTRLPAAIGTWRMTASETTDPKAWRLPASDLAALSLDSWTQRVYTDNRTGSQIVLLLEYRRLGRGAFNHRPEACYPASGFVLTGRREAPIFYGGHVQNALTLVADYRGSLGTSHQTLLYWFAQGERTETNFWKQQAQMALGRLQPSTNGWAFVRLVTFPAPGGESSALACEQDFARQASPAIVAAIAPAR